MSIVCPACATENRDAAKFCRGCGARLDDDSFAAETTWAETHPGDLWAEEERTVIVAPAQVPKRTSVSAPPTPVKKALVPPTSSPPSRWPLWAALAGLALLAAAVLMWWLGAKSPHPPVAVPAPTMVTPPPTPMPPPTPAPTEPPAPVLEPAPPPEPEPETTPASATVPVPPVPTPAAPKPRARPIQAPAETPAPEPAPPTAPVAAPAPAPVVPRVVSPQETCAGLGFIARARCLALECAKPNLASHPQCEAVREQQRIEERARNPQG